MKRFLDIILVNTIILNTIVIYGGNTVYAVEPDVVWLEKKYDNIYDFSEGLVPVILKRIRRT